MAAIEELKRLSKKHPDPGFWAHNIVTANGLCKTDLDHKHFWSYLSNPDTYDPDLVEGMRTLGDHIDSTECTAPPLPDCMEQIVHRNGYHILIEHRLKPAYKEAQRLKQLATTEKDSSDDEKSPPEES
jgi:hypothetical protein